MSAKIYEVNNCSIKQLVTIRSSTDVSKFVYSIFDVIYSQIVLNISSTTNYSLLPT